MGFFNKYPYTNEHELNLDWIIAKINALKDRVKAVEDAIHDIVVLTPNNGKLTIKRNNTIIGDFTADQATNEDINIVVPENTSDLNNDSDFITLSDLPDMSDYYDKTETDALLADKADVSDLPDMTNYYDKTETNALLADKADVSDIPTVNNATLTIQKNGTTIDTFTANSAANKTVNIKVGEIQYIDIHATPTANGNIKIDALSINTTVIVSALLLNQAMDSDIRPILYTSSGVRYWGVKCTYNIYPYQPITDPIDVRVFYFNY